MASTSLTSAGQSLDPFRYGKTYTVMQAAHLANLAPTAIRAWLTNATDDDSRLRFSFLDLIELAVILRFEPSLAIDRLSHLRRAHAFLAARFGTDHPFASQEMLASGGALLHDFDLTDGGGSPIAVDLGGVWAIPGAVTQMLSDVDFSESDGLAERWFPAGRAAPIVLDPRVGGGRLTVSGRGVTVTTIHQRFLAGESIEFLASDYELDETTVEDAIRFGDRGDRAVA